MSLPETRSTRHHELADAVAMLHMAIVVFFMFGWLLPSTTVWWAVILGGFGLQATWLLFANQCPLTVLEAHLRGESKSVAQTQRIENELEPQSPHFVAGVLTRFVGRPVSAFVSDLCVYAVLYVSMSLSAWRLFG